MPKQTEAQFQQAVIEVARWTGWLVHHTRPARKKDGTWSTPIAGDPGFPDLVLCHPDRGIIFAELKSDTGAMSPAQVEWARALFCNGAEVVCWRPDDWPAIRERLLPLR